MKIRTKITGMGLLLVLLAAASIVGIALYQEQILERNIGAEVEQLVRSETNRVAQDVYIMCRAMQESLDEMLAHGLKVAMELGTRQGVWTSTAPRPLPGKRSINILAKVTGWFRRRLGTTVYWLGNNTD
ncbi:MAG: hypothetical protein R2864_15205 [Syntrophotaleaceae bacterium]